MIINIGSINIDHVYRVARMPLPGETISAKSYQRFLGGKGVNQSVSIARSGGTVHHIGAVGLDGDWALSAIQSLGVATDYILRVDEPTGNAVIFVDDAGENEIVISGGANRQIDPQVLARTLSEANSQDWLLLQNETNIGSETAQVARQHGIKVAYSAAPFDPEHVMELLPFLTLLAVNESEASAVTELLGKPPHDWGVEMVLVTLGAKGARLYTNDTVFEQAAFTVSPVDTTGAGDTFLGAFLSLLDQGDVPYTALRFASACSALQVTQMGAATAIPTKETVIQFLEGA